MHAAHSLTTAHRLASTMQRGSTGSYSPPGPRLDKVLLVLTSILVLLAGGSALADSETGWRHLLRGELDLAARTAVDDDPRGVFVLALADTNAVFEGPAADLAAGARLAEADPAVAIERFSAARDAYLAAGDEAGHLVALERLCALWIETRDYQSALDNLPVCLELAESMSRPLAAAQAHLNLGRVLVRSRQVDEAATHLDAALATSVERDIPAWEANAHLALSIVSRLSMDLDTSLYHRESALDAYTRAGDQAGQARCLHYIGTIHIFKGNLTHASTLLHRGETLARSIANDEVLSGCLGDLGGIAYLIGDYDNALARYAEAVRLAGDPRRRGWYLLNSGSILAFQGRHEDALAVYADAHEAMIAAGDKRSEATILQVKGQSLCELKRYDEGLTMLDEAIDFAREWELPLDEAYALHFKGHALLDLGRLDEAAAALSTAGDMAAATGYFDITESALLGRAKVARGQGRLDEALSHLEEAVDIVNTVRRRSGGSAGLQSGYFSQVGRSFDEMVSVLGEMHAADPGAGHDRRAYDTAQMAKARSLLDLLAESEVDLRVRAGGEYQEREAEILGGIAALQTALANAPADSAATMEAEIAGLESRLDLLEAELREADPRYAELRYPRPCTLTQAQRDVLHEGELLLEYQLGLEDSHLFAVTRNGFRMISLPARAEIEDQVRGLLPMLRDYNVTGAAAAYYEPAARTLASLLLDPVADELADATRLTIVPDGALHYLPFEALPVRDGGGATYASLPFLALDTDVSYAPSVSALQRLRDPAHTPAPVTGLQVVADPVQAAPDETSVFAQVAGAAGLRPVPYVDEEITTLTGLGFEPTVLHRGAEATTAALAHSPASTGCRYLHFAAHGLFNEQSPAFSGLALSPDAATGDDGFLSVSEIFALDLDCEQVTLSACSSALGEQIDGEGLVGLTRAFMYAGARGVVAALWDVPGRGAAVFMNDYYGRLADGEASVTALSGAKRAMIRGGDADGLDMAHPAMWASFVLSGGID
jgi:CHAT domain-containing protein/tetratricopeptide (TPR) repeat protein